MTTYNSREINVSELKRYGVSVDSKREVMTGSRRLTNNLLDGLVKTVVDSEEVIISLTREKPSERARHLEKALSHGLCDDGNVPFELLSTFAVRVEKETGMKINLSKYNK